MSFVRSAFNEEPILSSSANILQGAHLLPYLERLPRVLTASPQILILLHGRNAKAETIFSVEGLLDPSYHIISIRGTYPTQNGEFEWFLPYDYDHPAKSVGEAHFIESEDILTEMIRGLMKEKGFSEDRLFLLGFSQGAAISYLISLRGNIEPKGVIPMSGFFPRPILQWNKINTSSDFLITHGTEDNVLPASESIFAHEFLISKGISSEYYAYKGRHKMTVPLLKYTDNWIKQHTL